MHEWTREGSEAPNQWVCDWGAEEERIIRSHGQCVVSRPVLSCVRHFVDQSRRSGSYQRSVASPLPMSVKGQFLALATNGLLLSGVLRNVFRVLNSRVACGPGPCASASSFRMVLPICVAFRHSWWTGCKASGQAPGSTQTAW